MKGLRGEIGGAMRSPPIRLVSSCAAKNSRFLNN
jgi:hypothetical protein